MKKIKPLLKTIYDKSFRFIINKFIYISFVCLIFISLTILPPISGLSVSLITHKIINFITSQTIIGIATVTVAMIIPLVVLVISSPSKENKTVLDKEISINTLFTLDHLKILLLNIVIPILILDVVTIIFLQALILFWFLFGIIQLIKILDKGYRWFIGINIAKDYANQTRLEYLKDISDNDEKRNAWLKIWKSKRTQQVIEVDILMKEFIEYLESLVYLTKTNKLQRNYGSIVINQFINQFNSLDLYSDIYETLLNFVIRGISHVDNIDKMGRKFNIYFDTFGININRLFFSIINKSTDDGYLAYMFFQNAKSFKWQDENFDKNKFIKNMIMDLLKIVEKKDKIDDCEMIFNNFPEEWKITYKNLQDNDESKIILEQYRKWVINKYYERQLINKKVDFNPVIERLHHCLLLDADPILWGRLFNFEYAVLLCVHSAGPTQDLMSAEVRVKRFVDSYENFGFIMKPFIALDVDEKEWQNEMEAKMRKVEEAVFEINKITGIFPSILNKEKINQYLLYAKSEECKKYCKSDEDKERRRILVINILNKAMAYLKNNQ